MSKQRNVLMIGAAATLVAAAMTTGIVRSGSSEQITVADLAERTHFHGLAVDPKDSERLLLATHNGLFGVRLDGTAERISKTADDFMGFMPHPTDSAVLYASGHPPEGGNLGFIQSRDGGRTWQLLSPGAAGVADFHNMAISPADPNIIYGAYAGVLQVSRDGGKNWVSGGPAPEGLLDLAAASGSPDELLAGTKFGLLRSTDAGKSWAPAYDSDNPVPLVQVSPHGTVFAFVVGAGLLKAQAPGLAWSAIGAELAGRYILHLAIDPREERRLYAVTFDRATEAQEILASPDAGVTWVPVASSRAG